MPGNQGYNKAEWAAAVEQVRDNPPEGEAWAKMVKATVRRYKAHASATLTIDGRHVDYEDGTEELVDEQFMLAVERECPVDDLFRHDFRLWVTANVRSWDYEDPNRAAREGAARNETIKAACTRLLVRLMNDDAKVDRQVPPYPLFSLKNHPFPKSSLKNQVKIEEVQVVPVLALRETKLDGEVMLPPYAEENSMQLGNDDLQSSFNAILDGLSLPITVFRDDKAVDDLKPKE